MSDAPPASQVRLQPQLLQRWTRAVEGAGGRGQRAVFDALCARHAEPQRYYHTLDHVAACLSGLDHNASAADHVEEVELALWYHDAVYDPKRPDNEALSAELAREELMQLGVHDAAVARVCEHIAATQHHRARSRDGVLVIDLDLGILGAPPDVYERFEQNIRREYAFVIEKDYVTGRSRVLTGFLSRPQIYQTSTLRAALEGRARANLSAALQRLNATPPSLV